MMRKNRGYLISALIAALAMSGCTTVPSLPSTGHPLAIRQIVNRLQCEIARSVDGLDGLKDKNGVSWVRYYVAKATLTLQVNSDGTIAPDTSLLGPFGVGSYALGLGGWLTSAANRTATYGFLIDFTKAKGSWCTDEARDGSPPLEGDLGVGEWLTTVLTSHDSNDPFDRPRSISHRMDFTLDANIKLSPSYVLTRSRADAGLSLHRKDFHTLDIAIEYLSPSERNAPDYSKVCVVNQPGPCYVPVQVAAQPPRMRPVTPATPPAGSPPAASGMSPESKSAAPASAKSEETSTRIRRVRRQRSAPDRDIPPNVEQRLDRALQNLELRSIGPRF